MAQTNPGAYWFDAGSATSVVVERGHRVSPSDVYTVARGFGWTHPPDRFFERPELARSRTALEIDGVWARQLGFRADVPPGTWWVMLYIEAGIEDSSSVVIDLQGQTVDPGWMAFRPVAEPRSRPQKIYRVYHAPVLIRDQGFTLELRGGREDVGLLGLSLIPDTGPSTSTHRDFQEFLRNRGGIRENSSLDSLYLHLSTQPEDGFTLYWSQFLRVLNKAERYTAYAGWEWANDTTGLSLFERLHQAVMLYDGLLNHERIDRNPLADRIRWHRGRVLYWLGLERGGQAEIAGGRRDLGRLWKQYPADTLLAMYNGVNIDVPDRCDTLSVSTGAPAWSMLQREALCRLRDMAHWWVLERQAENGEMGGKLGDDVELFRWWPPLILSGDTLAQQGWQRLADGVWNSPQTKLGYARDVSDVEHASEFISDTAPMMVLFKDEPEYVDRLRYSGQHFAQRWTGLSPQKRRFFKSAWFSSDEVDTTPPKDRDLEMNTRAAKAVRYLAWKTLDPQVIRPLYEWSLAWASAAQETDKGKPRGLFPASMRLADDALNGDEPTWYEANMFWDYFEWSHNAGAMMMDQLYFAYTLTRDQALLEPLYQTFELIQKYTSEDTSGLPGSEAWAVAHLKREKLLWQVAGQWRFQSGDTRFDPLLMDYGTPYIRYRLSGNEHHLVEGLEGLLGYIRYNTPLRTTEAIHTDRVYARGADHVTAMLTGAGLGEANSPYFEVTWENTGEGFTALVTDAGSDELVIQVYLHEHPTDPITMRLWTLSPGSYEVILLREGAVVKKSPIQVIKKGQRIPIELPTGTLVDLQIRSVTTK